MHVLQSTENLIGIRVEEGFDECEDIRGDNTGRPVIPLLVPENPISFIVFLDGLSRYAQRSLGHSPCLCHDYRWGCVD